MRLFCHLFLGALGLTLAEVNLPARIILSSGCAWDSSEPFQAPPRSVEAYDEAVAYLERMPLASQVIDDLNCSTTEDIVEIRDSANSGAKPKPAEFDANLNIITWDPWSS